MCRVGVVAFRIPARACGAAQQLPLPIAHSHIFTQIVNLARDKCKAKCEVIHTTSGSAPQLTDYPITSARTRARSIVLPAPDQNGARIQSRGAGSNTVYAAFPNRLSCDHECRQCLMHRPFTNTLILDPLQSDAHARTTSPTNFSTSTF